ncbi:MAG: hypothetical protein AAF934_09210 [Bacteroidota bacterium]
MNIPRLKKLLFPVILIVLTHCEREQISDHNTPETVQIISFKALPQTIRDKIITSEQALTSSFAHKNDIPFGKLIPTRIYQRFKPNGTASYTLELSGTTQAFYYDNLVINEDAKGQLNTHIIRYRPDASWYYRHKAEGLGYKHYSGTLTVFDETGKRLSTATLTDGKLQQKAPEALSSKAECEVLDVDYVGGCAGEDYCWWDEITITVYCGSDEGGGGGGQEMENDLENDAYDGGGGGAGSPGGNGGVPNGPGEPIDTVPVDEELEEEDINIDPEFLEEYPCQAQMVQEVYGNCAPLSQLFQDIFESNDNVNVTFTAADLNNIFKGAQTNGGLPNNYTIQLNTERLEQSTELDIINTATHEYVHAIMFHYFYQGAFQLTGAGNPPTYAELAEGFAKHRADFYSEANQHEYMTSLVHDIAEVTYTWAAANGYDPGDFASYDNDPTDGIDGLKEFLRQLAWNGLTTTTTFQELYPGNTLEKQAIQKLIQDEAFPNDADATPKGSMSVPCN